MTERLSSWDPKVFERRGIPSKGLINVYRRWGEGGIGHILTGNIMIEYDHLEAAGNPIIPRGSEFSGERFEAFKEMASEAKKEGSLMVGQVSHPGRQVQDTIQKNPISASDVQLTGNLMGMTFAKPRAATEEDISNVIEGFAHAAEYLEKAGFDGIELHGVSPVCGLADHSVLIQSTGTWLSSCSVPVADHESTVGQVRRQPSEPCPSNSRDRTGDPQAYFDFVHCRH
jgi:hypothetical protein